MRAVDAFPTSDLATATWRTTFERDLSVAPAGVKTTRSIDHHGNMMTPSLYSYLNKPLQLLAGNRLFFSNRV